LTGFKLVSKFKPSGDQPKAISRLVELINQGSRFVTLKGITGSGKTFTIANVIQQLQRPALIISPNKTLAAQLFNEFKGFFPESEVHFFISYYDYYRPEAYLPATDTYLEKDASINEELDRLRHAATVALLECRHVIIVASVSCIYGIGAPSEYLNASIQIKVGDIIRREELALKLAENLLYSRSFDTLKRGTFRLVGEILELIPSHLTDYSVRITFNGLTVEKIDLVDILNKKVKSRLHSVRIFPASHFASSRETLEGAIKNIEKELQERLEELRKQGKVLEAERLESRTLYDIALLRETGSCPGVENYSRHLSGRKEGEPPVTLIDYFPSDFLCFIDESHVSVPQLRGMYAGDRSRKETLVEYGFRLPSALDNRPLKFEEFLSKISQVVFISATPGPFELKVSGPRVVELINRPTGILDPLIEIRPAVGQVKNCLEEVEKEIKSGGKALILTITKKLAEELALYFREKGLRARYIHSDLNAIERYELLMSLRQNQIDVLIGINLLREGLDLVEVSLVCILDADKEGFLRSSTSLIQIIGRAARNLRGRAILYADRITKAIKEAVEETDRRRQIQIEFNKKHKRTPQAVKAFEFQPLIGLELELSESNNHLDFPDLKELEEEMWRLAKAMKFDEALLLRDKIKQLKMLKLS
jgi:excinuclease ABC subunit B